MTSGSAKDEKKLKAYVLSDRTEYNEHCEVVYAYTAREARKHCRLDDVEYINVAAKRASEFDKFAPLGPKVTDMLAYGWWWQCGNCWESLHKEDDQYGEEPMVIEDQDAFCNATCQAIAQGRKAGVEFKSRELEVFRSYVEKRFPEAECLSIYSNAYACRESFQEEGYRLFARMYFDAVDRCADYWDGDQEPKNWSMTMSQARSQEESRMESQTETSRGR